MLLDLMSVGKVLEFYLLIGCVLVMISWVDRYKPVFEVRNLAQMFNFLNCS